MKKISRIFNKMTLCFVIAFCFLTNLHAQDSKWQRTNIGGGGAMNYAAAGPTGTIVAATDLGGAYIKRHSDQQWQIIGPTHGMNSTHVVSIAFHPTNPDIIFLATDGGIYRSSDEGRHFTLVEGGDKRVFHFIAISPSNPNIVYASVTPRYNRLTDSSGFLAPMLMRSNDGGLSFKYVSRPQDSIGIDADVDIVGSKIITHPNDPNLIVILSVNTRFIDITSPNVYISTDGGATWRQIGNAAEPTDFIFHPTTPHYAFLAYKDSVQGIAGIKVSADLINNVWQDIFNTSFFPTGADPHLLLWPLVANGNPTGVRALNIYTSWYHDLPRQAAWRINNSNGTIDTDNSWQIEELGNVEQWAGNTENWRLGWSKIHSILNPGMASRAATIGFDLSDSNKIYWVTNQFVFSVSDKNTDKKPLTVINLSTKGDEQIGWQSTGLDNITPFILEINQADSDVIYAGLNDLGCIISRDAGVHWQLCNHDTDKWPGIDGHSYGGVVTALASDPQAAENVWMFAAGDQNQAVAPFFSNDYGANWTPGNTADYSPTNLIYGLSIDPTSPRQQRRLFVTIDGSVYRSENHGQSWNVVFECSHGCRVTKVNPNTGDVLAGGEHGLFISKNNGNIGTWRTVLSQNQINGFNHGNIFSRGSWGGISAIAIDNNNPDIILASVFQNDTSQGLYRCNLSMIAIATQSCSLLQENVAYLRDVTIDPTDSNIIYTSSSSAYTSGGYKQNSGGVYRTTDGGSTWIQVNEGLEWPMAIPISINPDNTSKVFIGSPGGGFYWRIFDDFSFDTDNDGIVDNIDNCIYIANPDQRDSNSDGFGNACDADLDNNGIVSFADLNLFKSVFGTHDPDADFDGNGSVSFKDLKIFRNLFGLAPGSKSGF